MKVFDNSFEFSNVSGVGRSGVPRLFLISMGGNAVEFKGESIEGLCVVTEASYKKAGKWSGTDFTIQLAPKVLALFTQKDMHSGRTFTGQTFEAVLEELNKKLPRKYVVNREFLKEFFAPIYEQCEKQEQLVASLERQGADTYEQEKIFRLGNRDGHPSLMIYHEDGDDEVLIGYHTHTNLKTDYEFRHNGEFVFRVMRQWSPVGMGTNEAYRFLVNEAYSLDWHSYPKDKKEDLVLTDNVFMEDL